MTISAGIRDLYELSRQIKDPLSKRLVRERLLEGLPPWLRRIYFYASKHTPVMAVDVAVGLNLKLNTVSNGLNDLVEVGLLRRRRNDEAGKLQWTVVKERKQGG